MSKTANIYPMAFQPEPGLTCRLYYVGFPNAWKERLIEIEKTIKPNWNSAYALPTSQLENSLKTWQDGLIALTPIRKDSNDEMWAVSYEQEIDTKQLLEHIIIWLYSNYGNLKPYHSNVKEKIQELIDDMKVDELDRLTGCREVRLFDEEGIPTETLAYSAIPLMVTNALVGKQIMIDGHEAVLNYAGKNQLISDIQGEGDRAYSYGISFSLQTVPPERRTLILCDCSIHRWIPGKWKEHPYFNQEQMTAHVWVGNHRIDKLSIRQDYPTKEYFWDKLEEKCYNLYHSRSLPSAREVIDSLDQFAEGDPKITFLYKNGKDDFGFAKSRIGTGVSVAEKREILDGVFEHLSGLVRRAEGVKRVTKSSKRARKKLKLDEINLNQELTEEQRAAVAHRIRECIEADRLNLEVYYRDDTIHCANEILNRLSGIFQSTKEITFDLKLCPLGRLGEALDSSKKEAVQKRIREIEKEVETADQVTGCIILLPGKDRFETGDPKEAIRHGFALQKRLTQFITPWNREEDEEGTEIRITSAIEDLCRQLGYIRELDKKVVDTEDALVHTPVIGMHVMGPIRTSNGMVKLLPLFVELDYVSGKVYVECDAFEQPRILYREAAFELAKLCNEQGIKEKCEAASRGVFRQKMIMWKNVYKNKNLLVLVEANQKTRTLCNGITDGKIQTYSYPEPYCPEKIEVGTKENGSQLNLNGTGVRLIRIRRNGEVPDYYTDLSEKEGYSAASGIFRYWNTYWSVASRPNDKAYKRSYKNTKYSMPGQNFSERDMIELYPIQLQSGDDPDEWVNYTDSLRLGAIQYDETMSLPLPIHLATKLEEYLLKASDGKYKM